MNEDKQKLLAEIGRLKKELKKKKEYGLVWDSEREPEEVVEMCKEKLPVLKEVKDKEIITDKNKPVNLLIEGDNYHALSVLNYTHAKKIDVIYIDPPYNTGAKDWKYNNAYVDINDGWRHSKWLSFMASRLWLAKNLLNESGVLICAIDDNELATVSLLFDKIFPEKVKNNVVIISNPHGVSRSGFSRTHEYAIFLLNRGQIINKKPAPEDLRNINLRRSGNNSLRNDSPTMFYPIWVDKKSLKIIGAGEVPKDNFHPEHQTLKRNEFYELWPIDAKGVEKNWYYSRKRVIEKGENELVCKWIKGKLCVSFHHSNNSEQTYKTVWTGSEYDAGAYGATLVKNLTSTDFPFPKSINTVRDCLRAVAKSKDTIVLDFFAGSGTTGQAVLELNKEDGGNRKFILCTNNESKICEEVTYPRINRVISGYQKNGAGEKDLGLGGNLKYFKTGFVDYKESTDRNKIKLTMEVTEMLCVKEGTFELVQDNQDFKIFKNHEYYTGIIFDQLAIKDFKKAIRDIKSKFSVYIFSLGDDSFDEEFEDIKQKVKLSPIPEAILKVYRRIYK